jgi:hypothetical protein
MKACVRFLAVIAGLSGTPVHSLFGGEAGRELLDEIMDKPGGWSQMCSFFEPTPFEAPVPMFTGSLLDRYFDLGVREAVRLQTARHEVVPVLVEELNKMDLSKAPNVTRGPNDPGEGGGTHAGFKLNWLNHLHLQVVRELNAVETLPALLRLEARLQTLLAAAENDTKSALPALDVDASIMPLKPGESEEDARRRFAPDGNIPRDAPEADEETVVRWWASETFKRERQVYVCRVIQRELLGTMTVLLRNEGFAPAKEAFDPLQRETRVRLLVEARSAITEAEKKLAESQTKAVGKAHQRAVQKEVNLNRFYVEEAVRKLEQLQEERPDAGFEAAYTPILRAEIRALTERFLISIPPEKRKGAAAMPKHGEKK